MNPSEHDARVLDEYEHELTPDRRLRRAMRRHSHHGSIALSIGLDLCGWLALLALVVLGVALNNTVGIVLALASYIAIVVIWLRAIAQVERWRAYAKSHRSRGRDTR